MLPAFTIRLAEHLGTGSRLPTTASIPEAGPDQ
jgi:hypothetical protein